MPLKDMVESSLLSEDAPLTPNIDIFIFVLVHKRGNPFKLFPLELRKRPHWEKFTSCQEKSLK